MKRWTLAGALVIMLLVTAACSGTSNTPSDSLSAQQLLPSMAAYTATDVDPTVDGAFAAVGGASLLGGQVGITAAIAKVEQVLQCFQDRGAIAARFYTEDSPDSTIPDAGAVLVINQTRINQELINCILGGQEERVSAQSLGIQPCASAGTFDYEDNTISYVYVGSQPRICELYQQHFDALAEPPDL